jgi:lipopolysaccharide export system protein LptA
MKRLQYILVSFIILPTLIMMFPSSVLPEAPQKQSKGGDTGQMVIHSNTLEIDSKQKIVIVTFIGDVDAKGDDFTINCQKMLLYYNNNPSGNDSGKGKSSIEKIIATGRVKISQPDGGLAMAEKAIYYQNDEKVVLTGNPKVKQENYFVEGSRITLFLKEKRHVVEGSGDKKIKAVIFPGGEKR